MIKTILVDDERPALDELEYLLKDYEDISIVGKFREPRKALEYVLMHDVDVCFLDISMPEMDGFILAEAIIKLRKPPKIIFATAFDEYAIKAFEYYAVDYLLKPIEEQRMAKTMKRLKEVVDKSLQPLDDIDELLKKRYMDQKATRIPFWKNDRIHLLNPKDIDYIETKDKETHIYTKKGEFISTDSLGHYEDILSSYGFYRCHRSYMISIEKIKEVIPWFNNTFAVKLADYESEIPVSRRNVKEFKEFLHL